MVFSVSQKKCFPKGAPRHLALLPFPNRVLPEMAYICCLSNIITLSMFYFLYEN